MTLEELKELITSNIKPNNNREITGQVLQDTLVQMADPLDDDVAFGGVISPRDVITQFPAKTVCIAAMPGEYNSHGGGVVEPGHIGIALYTPGSGWEWSHIDVGTSAGGIKYGGTVKPGRNEEEIIEVSTDTMYIAADPGLYTFYGKLYLEEGQFAIGFYNGEDIQASEKSWKWDVVSVGGGESSERLETVEALAFPYGKSLVFTGLALKQEDTSSYTLQSDKLAVSIKKGDNAFVSVPEWPSEAVGKVQALYIVDGNGSVVASKVFNIGEYGGGLNNLRITVSEEISSIGCELVVSLGVNLNYLKSLPFVLSGDAKVLADESLKRSVYNIGTVNDDFEVIGALQGMDESWAVKGAIIAGVFNHVEDLSGNRYAGLYQFVSDDLSEWDSFDTTREAGAWRRLPVMSDISATGNIGGSYEGDVMFGAVATDTILTDTVVLTIRKGTKVNVSMLQSNDRPFGMTENSVMSFVSEDETETYASVTGLEAAVETTLEVPVTVERDIYSFKIKHKVPGGVFMGGTLKLSISWEGSGDINVIAQEVEEIKKSLGDINTILDNINGEVI